MVSIPKILIGPSSFAAVDQAPLDKMRASGLTVVDNPYKRRLTRPELLELLTPDVVGLIAGLEPLDRDVLSKVSLKVVSRCGSGMSNVDIPAAEEFGIAVRSTPDAPVAAVAELVLGAILCLLREIHQMDASLHRGEWDKRVGEQLEGKTVAVVGFGRIGRRVAGLMQAFGARIVIVDPFCTEVPSDCETADLAQALKIADIVTLHAAGEACLMGDAEFQAMRPGSYLINAARGGLIDEAALARALDDGRIKGAFLDTYGTEPYTGPLTGYSQVMLTPHVGSYTVQCRRQMEMEAVDNLLGALSLSHAETSRD